MLLNTVVIIDQILIKTILIRVNLYMDTVVVIDQTLIKTILIGLNLYMDTVVIIEQILIKTILIRLNLYGHRPSVVLLTRYTHGTQCYHYW